MDDLELPYRYTGGMLDYARQRARNVLKNPGKVILATSGPAGVHVGEFPCEAIDLELYLLIPKTSDHLFNLEHDSMVTLLANGWELKGRSQILPTGVSDLKLSLLCETGAEWCVLVRVDPWQLHIRRREGWGSIETIDLESPL